MEDLQTSDCCPCHGGEMPLPESDVQRLLAGVPGWRLERLGGGPRLVRVYEFPNFRQALAFTQRVGELAEAQGHHPVLTTEWGQVTVVFWTHATGGLHRNDFIMAARTDGLPRN